MNINPVESVQSLSPSAVSVIQDASLAPSQSGQQSFTEWITNSVTHVDRALTNANQATADFALDGAAPPHHVMMALEDARMSLQLALQVRARLVEGYQELMRMQL